MPTLSHSRLRTGPAPAGRFTIGFVLAALVAALFAAAPARAADGAITGLAGKCVDVAGANSANGTAVQLYGRVDAYQRFTQILGVSPGSNLYC